jgi:hypothetical protein
MPRMSAGELKALLAAGHYDALSAMMASKLSDERATVLNYYMGNSRSNWRHRPPPATGENPEKARVEPTLLDPIIEKFTSRG